MYQTWVTTFTASHTVAYIGTEQRPFTTTNLRLILQLAPYSDPSSQPQCGLHWQWQRYQSWFSLLLIGLLIGVVAHFALERQIVDLCTITIDGHSVRISSCQLTPELVQAIAHLKPLELGLSFRESDILLN
ncbi:hypothetical protein FNE72_28300 [Klebsiella pneumoniae]|nr:hypothetical protein FNE72_28300 [Klebsiella pneumoniae]